MTDDVEAMGPISYLIVEFPGNKMTGAGLASLVDLVDRGVIRILDLEFVTCRADGSVAAVQLRDLDSDGQFDLTIFEGASSGLLDQSDFDEAGEALDPGSSAGILIFENRWATSFVQGMRQGGAELVAAGYIPLTDIAASLDARPSPADSPDDERKDEDMPGRLLRGVARTAVVAGTATAVSNRVSRRQANRWSQQSEAEAYEQQQQYQQY